MTLQEAPPLDVVAAIPTVVRAGVAVPAARQFSGGRQAMEPSEVIAGALKERGAKRTPLTDSPRSRRLHSPTQDCDVKTSGPGTRGGLDEKGGEPASVAIRETKGCAASC